MQRSIDRIAKQARDDGLITPDQARTLTESTSRARSASRGRARTPTPSVQRAIEQAAQSPNSTVKVDRPDGSVEVRKGEHAASGNVDVASTRRSSRSHNPTPTRAGPRREQCCTAGSSAKR